MGNYIWNIFVYIEEPVVFALKDLHVSVLTFLFRLFSITQGNTIPFQLPWLPIFALTVGIRLNWSRSQLYHSFAFFAIFTCLKSYPQPEKPSSNATSFKQPSLNVPELKRLGWC